MTGVAVSEDSVLRPCDPFVDTDPDSWPEFELSDVRTHLLDDAAANVNLLHASELHPLTVVGRLEPLPKELVHLYRHPGYKRFSVAIEIAEVSSFAWGQYDDGSVALWAAGKCGWYSLKPARAYSDIYSEMIDAIKTLYFIADAYRGPRRSGKVKNAATVPDYSPQELFEKYAVDVMGVPKAAPEAAKKIYKHRDFLLSSMIAGKEGVAWGKNPLYQHLWRKFPADFTAMKERLAGHAKSHVRTPKARRDSIDTASTNSSPKRKRGRPQKTKALDNIVIGSSSSAGSDEIEPQKPELATHESTKPRSKPLQTSNSAHQIRPEPTTQQEERVSGTQNETASSTPIHEESRDERPQRGQKGRSSLRPKLSKGSKGGKGKAPVLEGSNEKEEGLPLSPAGEKRKLHEPPEARRRKQQRGRQDVDEGIDIPESPSASDEVTSPDTPEDTTAGAASEMALRTNHEPDPVQEDTWVCALDGCTHKVYLASRPDSQRLIREHYKLHAYDEDERVQLVKRMQAPSLPATHLIARVRQQAKLEGFPGSHVAGTRFPQPIVQRY